MNINPIPRLTPPPPLEPSINMQSPWPAKKISPGNRHNLDWDSVSLSVAVSVGVCSTKKKINRLSALLLIFIALMSSS